MAVWTHPMFRHSLAGLALASVVILGGCQGKGAGHEQAVNNANTRWHTLRSNAMLKLAQQQFDTGDLDQAEKTLVEAMSIDISNASLHVLAGRIAIERGELERAHSRFGAALELDGKQVGALYYQGIVHQRWQQYPEAYECYTKAHELQSDNISFILAMGEMLVAMDQRDEAMTLLESKVRVFDQNAAIRTALGHLHLAAQNYGLAVDYLKQAAYLMPDNLQMIENLAAAQLLAGRSAEAVRHLERLTREPANRDRPGLRHMLAAAYEGADRLVEAREIYIELTRQNPRDIESWCKLASLSLVSNDTAGALTAAQRVMSLDGQRHEGYLIAAMVWQKRGQLDQAVRLFDRAATLAPQHAEPVILRGIALEQSGQPGAAASAYAEALRRNPDDTRARNLLDRLSRVD